MVGTIKGHFKKLVLGRGSSFLVQAVLDSEQVFILGKFTLMVEILLNFFYFLIWPNCPSFLTTLHLIVRLHSSVIYTVNSIYSRVKKVK